MKAFSFQTILKNFGKQLSSLASQMPWCNLRFNLGSMSVLSRVNPLFSRTSFGTSRRASHFAAIFTILFTVGVGNMWGETVLFSTDFSTWLVETISAGSTKSGVYFKSNTTIKKDAGMTFAGNASTSANYIAIPLSNINTSITVTVTFSSSRPQWKNAFTGYSSQPTEEQIKKSPSSVSDNTRPSSATETSSWTIETTHTNGVFYIGKGSNNSVALKSLTITTPSSKPSHSVTVSTEDANKGTASAASTIVAEGATTTITATPNSGYQFDHWTVSGTGASLSSTTTNPTTLTMGTSDVTVTAYFVEKTCPTSGTLYTAAVKSSVSSNQSFPANSATTEVSPSTQADITGGQLFAINGESSAKNLIANSSGYKFCMTNNSTKFKLVLECELQAGDIITIDGVGGTKNDAPIGLWVSSSDSRPGSAPACSGTSTTTSLVDDLVNYTVTSSDEYYEKSILYIHRAVGSSTYFNNINISRPAAASCTNPTASWSTAPADGTAGGNMNASLTTNYAAGVVYTSSNTDVATVSGNGTTTCAINYVAAGTARITATVTGDGSTICVGPATCYTDITVSAPEPETYSITYECDGATSDCPSNATEQTVLPDPLPTPTKTGYTFDGWYTDAEKNTPASAGDPLEENTTLYAKWTANNYTITYNGNHPTNAWNAAFAVKNIPAEQTLTGGTGNVSTNTPVITEAANSDYAIYDFAGWNTAADGKGTSYAAGAAITITENTTLYAQWTPRTYTIKYYDTDKTTVLDLEPKNYTYGTGVASLPTPTKDGYTFSSWTKWWDGGEESNVSSISNTTWGDANLAAQWTAVKVSSITVAPSSKTLEVGGTQQLAATVSPDNALDKTVTWSTSNGSVATVSSTGLVTAVAAGTCTITATANDGSGKTGTCSITVEAAAAGNEVVATWPMISGSSLTLVGSADHASVTPSNAVKAGTNISNLTDMVDALFTDYTGKMAKVTASGTIGESNAVTNDHYLKYTLTVASGYKFTPTGFSATVARFGTDNAYAQVVLKQGATTIKATDASKPSRSGKSTAKTVYSAEFDDASTYSAGTSIDLYIYLGGGMASGKYYGVLAVSITGTYESAACTTPAAPTSPTNGETTSNSQAVSWTDTSNDAWEVYLSTSSSTPGEGQSPTAEPTTASYTFTGLTASTTYYWWVRSVCDASHKSAWVAGSSFTTTSAPAELTAIEANVLYQAADMANITFTGSDQWFAGLSTNAKFKTYGDGSSTSAKGKTVSSTSITDDIDTKNFTSIAYIMTADNTSSSSDPTKGAIEFITPSTAGYLYLYFENTSSALTLKKKGTSTSTSLSGAKYKKVAVEANTHYFINGAGSNRGLYGIKFIADVTAPTFVSSVPANGATDVATSGTIVLTFNEALGSVDASKFTLTGATKGAVAIDGSDATKVNIAYSGAANEATVTLATAAAAVSDVAGNALAAALSNISFTTAAAAPAGDCEELFAGSATSTSKFTITVGNATTDLSSGNSFSAGGYSYSVKPNSSNAIVASPDGGSFAAGDSLIVVVYNNQSGAKTMGFQLGSGKYSASVGSKKLHIFRQVLVASDISEGKVTFNRQSSDDRWVEIIIKHCGLLPSCTTPELSDLEDQIVCPGENVSWTANNTRPLADGETTTYQWTKKGNATILSPTATLTLNDVTEATGGTYVVTATVSAEGKASKTASKEVTLTVTPATATPNITASASTVYADNPVTLTATCVSSEVTYQWYTCTDADGDGESEIGEAENAEYTPSTATVGTYYYKVKVTGDGTHSCGTAEGVYELVISPAAGGDCFHYVSVIPTGSDIAISSNTSIVTPTHATTLEGGTMKVGSSQVTISKNNGLKLESSKSVSITLDAALEAGNVVIVKGSTATAGNGVTINGVNFYESDSKTFDVSYTVAADDGLVGKTALTVTKYSGSSYLREIKITGCGEACTDPEVIATVDNATICAGTESTVTFTATNYADGAEFQWQKKDGNTWSPISGAISDTYIISSVTTEHAGQYRVIAKKECSRTSEEVTLTVLTAPEFNAFANTASVMKGNALTINDVEATNATDYTWYKSADATYDAGTDTKVGTTKELLLAASSITEEADQIFYLFCVASNSCGSVTSNAITVTVTPFVEEECATAGNEGEHEFGFDEDTECSLETYGDSKTPVWKTNSRNKYLTYTAPEGKYFATAKVTVAHSEKTKCGYAYSTNGGTTWTFAEKEGLSTTLNAITIDLPENVNTFRISRNLQDGNEKDWGVTSGTFYLAEACFTYENACTPTSVIPTTTSFEYNMSVQMDFVEPTFTVKHGEEVVNDAVLTYTSSNPAIATVDEEGSVTFEGMTGTVTITAAYAGTTIDEIEYCASEGSYTITVGCTDQAPTIKAATSTNLDGCNNSITLEAKMQDGTTAFTDGTFQWYRDGEAIEGATSASYEVVRAGTYTVSRTYTCTTMSSNSAVVTNENPEPKVERLTPFQYYHVDKDYSNQMKDRHLFAVTSYGTLDGKRYHLTATRNGDALVLSSSTAFFTTQSSDNAVDTVMIDLNELKGKYSANDEIVITCAPINNCNQVSTITSSITIYVIDETPTLALICSGANGDGTRDTEKLVVGGDFLTGYNKADLCQQTGNKTFDPDTEWGFYTLLKEDYIVTPVNGYAQFNKLNYEPFDILLLTDYPKSSKSEAAQKIIDDMAELCDYRPLLSFKTHFQSDKWKDKTTGEYKYTKWVKKGFTTAPVVPKQTATYVNIVCYAHPMFEDIDDINDQYTFHDDDDPNQLVYQVLTGPGHEGKKGIQGFELADADNFVTIGLVHYNAIAEEVTHDDHTHISWNAEANDRLLVAMAERQTNIEARMMLFSLNCGAQSLQTEGGRQVILKCLEYLLETDPLKVADCRMTFDNGAGNADFDPNKYEGTGTRGDSLWSTAANWGPDYLVVPGRNNDVRIAAPCIVDGVKTKVSVGDEVQETIQYYPEVLSIHITENGSLTIPANSSLTARSTILRADEKGNVYPTNVADISLGSNADGNASLILNNERGDTKAGVAMYSKAKAGKGTTWQYIGTPHSDVSNATYNYYDSWIYSWNPSAGWEVVPTGGAVYPWVGYCITHPEQGHTYWMEGTLVETTTQEIEVPSNSYQIIGNSWTAPIQIANFEEEDFENIETKTIYFFNTGSDPEGDNDTIENATGDARYETGTYIPVPIHAADYRGDVTHIPSMQGFYVANNNPTSAGTLHLDYERHVRAPRKNTPSGPMHAPARINAKDDEPIVAKLLVCGKRYDDKLILLEREDFTGGYDSGWDGDKWDGGTISPTIWAVNEIGGADAVAAIPEFEGTVIGFRAGEDNIYTIHFDYDGMEEALYLLDTETKIYTRVLKGNSYTFACPDKAEHNRFILTRKAPQIATGTENIATGENAKAVKFIKDDKIFIFVNGILYDATGKMVVR